MMTMAAITSATIVPHFIRAEKPLKVSFACVMS